MQLKFAAVTGTFVLNAPSSIATCQGAGPRRLAFHPDGRFLYLLDQTDATISTYRIEPGTGTLAEIQMITPLPAHFLGEANSADILLTPEGRRRYVSGRQTSTLAGFRVDPADGLRAPVGRWRTETTPRVSRSIRAAGSCSRPVSIRTN